MVLSRMCCNHSKPCRAGALTALAHGANFLKISLQVEKKQWTT